MRALVRVIDAGSFSEAARQLRIGQPAISKAIIQLEAEVGVRLISRTTRGLSPSDAGQRFYERAVRAIEESDEADIAARGAGSSLTGRLRVSLAVTFGRLHVIPYLPAFLERHPHLELDLIMEDKVTDLIEEGVDVAFRMGAQPDSSLSGRIIGSRPRLVVGSQDYFSAAGIPKHPLDLERHSAVVLSLEPGTPTWEFARGTEVARVTPAGRVHVSAADGLRSAVLAGLGYTVGSEWAFGRDLKSGRVQAVLTDWSLPPVHVWAIYPSARHPSARAREFAAFVAASINAS